MLTIQDVKLFSQLICDKFLIFKVIIYIVKSQ